MVSKPTSEMSQARKSTSEKYVVVLRVVGTAVQSELPLYSKWCSSPPPQQAWSSTAVQRLPSHASTRTSSAAAPPLEVWACSPPITLSTATIWGSVPVSWQPPAAAAAAVPLAPCQPSLRWPCPTCLTWGHSVRWTCRCTQHWPHPLQPRRSLRSAPPCHPPWQPPTRPSSPPLGQFIRLRRKHRRQSAKQPSKWAQSKPWPMTSEQKQRCACCTSKHCFLLEKN